MPPTWVSKTLRLPRSTLPARALPSERPRYIRHVTDDLYAWQKEHNDGLFVLHDGPPYANGDLHIGHALNKILKDITCRYQISQGIRVDFRPGWDCHGLPIELKAVQAQKDLNAVEVRQAARELAASTVNLQKERFREWAVMADWESPWRTMDKDYEIRQLEIFKLMVENGQIYRRLKPVYWSPSSRTALAEAELEYNSDHRSIAAYVKFPLKDIPQSIQTVIQGSDISVVIWTTTPWTLPANCAIAIRQDMQYSIIESTAHGKLLIATSRLPNFQELCQDTKELGQISGADLVSTTYLHPFRPSSPQPILHADFVTDDSGTGVVHVAPGHGMEDYKLCQSHGIEPFAPIDDAGLFTSEAFPGSDMLEGKDILGAGNKAVLSIIQGNGSLIATHPYRHKYPYDWRSKQPVVIRATSQWFADLSNIRDTAIKALSKVEFIPASGYERLSSFIKGRSEWCISRQRAWGVPIPALYTKSGEAVLTSESISHIISVIQARGIDAWWSDDLSDPAWIASFLQDSGPLTRGTDTMDVWFDSGTSWSELGTSDQTADVYLEGSDQHRGWFQSSLLTKIAKLTAVGGVEDQAPFKKLVTHGFTLDAKGKKMSKSEGNVISPVQITDGTLLPPMKRKSKEKSAGPVYDGMGPDALRLWVASNDFTRDVEIGEPMLKAINGSLAKLRVTYKLLTGLLDTYDMQKVDFADLRSCDRLAVMHSRRMKATVQAAYQDFAYHRAASAVNTYVNTELSAFYIETIKDRCYTDADYSKSRVHAQAVLWEIYRNLSEVILPITPLLVAESRDHLPMQLQRYDPFRKRSPDKFVTVLGEAKDEDLESLYSFIETLWQPIKTLQEQLRMEGNMGSSLDCFIAICLPDITKPEDTQKYVYLKQIEHELADLFVVSEVFILPREKLLETIETGWFKTHAVRHAQSSEEMDDDILVAVYQPTDAKCIRCWKYNVAKEKAQQLEDPICDRCLGVLEGQRAENPELFEGRPLIAEAALNCTNQHDSAIWDWNWDLKRKT